MDIDGQIAGLLMNDLDFLDVPFQAKSCGVMILLGRQGKAGEESCDNKQRE